MKRQCILQKEVGQIEVVGCATMNRLTPKRPGGFVRLNPWQAFDRTYSTNLGVVGSGVAGVQSSACRLYAMMKERWPESRFNAVGSNLVLTLDHLERYPSREYELTLLSSRPTIWLKCPLFMLSLVCCWCCSLKCSKRDDRLHRFSIAGLFTVLFRQSQRILRWLRWICLQCLNVWARNEVAP